MIIDKFDEITLDDNKSYIVTSKIMYQTEYYVYLTDVKDFINLKIFKINNENNNLIELDSLEIFDKIMPLFLSDIKASEDVFNKAIQSKVDKIVEYNL